MILQTRKSSMRCLSCPEGACDSLQGLDTSVSRKVWARRALIAWIETPMDERMDKRCLLLRPKKWQLTLSPLLRAIKLFGSVVFHITWGRELCPQLQMWYRESVQQSTPRIVHSS